MEYGAAKRKAARDLRPRPAAGELPSNEAGRGRGARRTSRCSAPTPSRPNWPALRQLALRWMERLADVPAAPGRRGLARHRDTR